MLLKVNLVTRNFVILSVYLNYVQNLEPLSDPRNITSTNLSLDLIANPSFVLTTSSTSCVGPGSVSSLDPGVVLSLVLPICPIGVSTFKPSLNPNNSPSLFLGDCIIDPVSKLCLDLEVNSLTNSSSTDCF